MPHAAFFMEHNVDDQNQQPLSGNNNQQFYREAVTAIIPNLSDIEIRICIRLAMGQENDQMCKEMHMDARVMDNHRSDIRRKIGMHRKERLRAKILLLVDEYRKSLRP